MTVDFDVIERVRPERAEDVVDAFAALAGKPVRIAGRATTQDRVPAPSEPVALLELGTLNRVLRLEPDDLTCSVEAGVTREDLERELADHRLCLPCAGFGTTIGGLFARGDGFALAPGGHSARSLLLGLEGVLPEGLRFKSGARVVKSVAGFDLHKLFVGSRGRLFAVTALHLKLRPLPERTVRFAARGLDREAAVGRFRLLRRLADPPQELLMTRGVDGGFTIAGALGGRARIVEDRLRRLELEPCDDTPSIHVEGAEVVCGIEIATRIDRLLEVLPEGTPFALTGGGRFEVGLEAGGADAVLEALGAAGTAAELWRGPRDRRGRSTSIDTGTARLSDGLARALDPEGMLR